MTGEMWLGVRNIYNSEISSISQATSLRSGHPVMTYSVRLVNDRSSALSTELV